MYKIKKDLFYLKCCVLSFSQLKTANYSGLKGFTIEYGRADKGGNSATQRWTSQAPSRFLLYYDNMNVFDISIRFL